MSNQEPERNINWPTAIRSIIGTALIVACCLGALWITRTH